MNIVGLQSVIYGAEDVDAATRFQEDWGLELVEKSTTGSNFKLPDDTSIHIRQIDDDSLPPPFGAWFYGARSHLGRCR